MVVLTCSSRPVVTKRCAPPAVDDMKRYADELKKDPDETGNGDDECKKDDGSEKDADDDVGRSKPKQSEVSFGWQIHFTTWEVILFAGKSVARVLKGIATVIGHFILVLFLLWGTGRTSSVRDLLLVNTILGRH